MLKFSDSFYKKNSSKILLKLVKHRFVDDWYPVSHSIKMTNVCQLKCIFCPASKYKKKNSSVENLEKNFDFSEMKWNVSNRFIGIGGGLYEVGEIEKNQKGWIKKLLIYLLKKNNKILLQTRSPLIIEPLGEINEDLRKNLVVIIGFFSVEDRVASLFEPNIASPLERLKCISTLRSMGYLTGTNLIPLLPEINGEKNLIETALKLFKDHGASFTLHHWAEKETLEQIYLETKKPFHRIQLNNEKIFERITNSYQQIGLSPRLLHSCFRNWLGEKDKIAVALRYLYYYHLFIGKPRDAYKMAAYHLSKLEDKEWDNLKNDKKILKLPGIGSKMERIILDFSEGNWEFIDKLEQKNARA